MCECGGQLQEWPDYNKCVRCNGLYPLRDNIIELADVEIGTARSTSDKRAQFRNAVIHFEGTQDPKSIPIEVREAIVSFADRSSIDLTRATKETLFTIMQKKVKTVVIDDTTKQMSEFFPDINLLHHEFTGTPLPDLAHIRNRLFARFDEVSKSGTSLKIQYILYRLLRLEEYPCDITDFPSIYGSESFNTWETEFKKITTDLKKKSEYRW